MIITAYEARASNDDSVTAESFLICRIILWHAPSQDGGNLFICEEERGKGGQLASTIRQPSDKQYITAWDSQTNERGSRNVHPGWTEFCTHPATLITCIALDIRILFSHMLRGVTPHTRFPPWHHACCHMRSGWLKARLPCETLPYRTMASMLHEMDAVYCNSCFTTSLAFLFCPVF